MAAPVPLCSKIRFGAFHLNAATGELQRSGIPIKLRMQAVQVLLMLTERAGQVVTREEIRERLWVKDTFVDFERGINFCINQIRATLGDSAEQPRFVETLPKRGYRFIAPVTVEVFRNSANIVHVLTPVETPVSQTPVGTPATTKIVPGLPADRPAQEIVKGHLFRKWALAAAVLLILTASGLAARAWLVRARGPSLSGLRPTKLTTSGSVSDVAISP